MSPRRRSGATRRAKKAAAGANNEQATASREVSTQQGTTVCEDEEAPAFGEVNEDSKGEKTQEQPEDVQAQDPAEGEQQRKEEEETDGSDKSAGQHVEGEDETDGFADEEQVSPEDINGKAEEEGESQERRKEVHKTNEMPVEAAAEAGREEEKAEQEVHTKEEEMKGQQEKGAGEEEKPTETEKKKEQEEVTEQWQEGQLKYEEQAKEHQEDALHQPAEAKEEEEADDDQQENEGTVAEERQGGPRLQHSGSFIEWTGSDAEFSVTPSAESMGLCCTRDARGSICEEVRANETSSSLITLLRSCRAWTATPAAGVLTVPNRHRRRNGWLARLLFVLFLSIVVCYGRWSLRPRGKTQGLQRGEGNSREQDSLGHGSLSRGGARRGHR